MRNYRLLCAERTEGSNSRITFRSFYDTMGKNGRNLQRARASCVFLSENEEEAHLLVARSNLWEYAMDISEGKQRAFRMRIHDSS
jgi:hypothetical protein